MSRGTTVTPEDNILIAEFLGWRELKHDGNEISFYSPDGIVDCEDMGFDSYWDWLMPCVDMIESLGNRPSLQDPILYYGMYKGNYYAGFKEQFPIMDDVYYGVEAENKNSKIEAVYHACINFIKWWNESV